MARPIATLALAAGQFPRAALEQTIQLKNARRLLHPLGDQSLTHAANLQPHAMFSSTLICG